MTCDPAIADTLGCYIGFKVVVNKEHKVSIKAKANDKTVIADVKDKLSRSRCLRPMAISFLTRPSI